MDSLIDYVNAKFLSEFSIKVDTTDEIGLYRMAWYYFGEWSLYYQPNNAEFLERYRTRICYGEVLNPEIEEYFEGVGIGIRADLQSGDTDRIIENFMHRPPRYLLRLLLAINNIDELSDDKIFLAQMSEYLCECRKHIRGAWGRTLPHFSAAFLNYTGPTYTEEDIHNLLDSAISRFNPHVGRRTKVAIRDKDN